MAELLHSNAWMQTYTGKAVYPLEFTADMCCIEDIAWSLSHQCRYAGHCKRFYSVAEHCLHLVSVVPTEFQLAALLHDASEAYLVDIPRPIKWALNNYREIEERIMRSVAKWAGVQFEQFESIKPFDTAILIDEQKQLLPNPPLPWNVPCIEFESGLGLEDSIQKGMGDANAVYQLFLETFNHL
jgi:uncharacterized protein